MSDYVLERTQEVPAPLPDVFAFFSNPGNLGRITPPWLGFRIVEAPAALEAGSRLEYRIRWAFLTLAWVTRITRWNPPDGFEDVQEKGPYRKWVHTHRFIPTARGVRVEDHVVYALPLGLLGAIVHRLRVRNELDAIFAYRREAVDRFFSSRPR